VRSFLASMLILDDTNTLSSWIWYLESIGESDHFLGHSLSEWSYPDDGRGLSKDNDFKEEKRLFF
jgi:hypothetical protein